MVPSEKSKTDLFASSIMKCIGVLPAWFRFPIKLICCFFFSDQYQVLVVYLKLF